jgi:NifB/MoaA-like Fe-S oxidoreductase
MNSGEELQQTIEDVKKLQEKKKRLISAITNGVMELSDAKEAMDEIKNRIESLEQQRHEIAANIMNPPDWSSIDLTRDEFNQLGMIHQREFLQLIIEKVDLFNMHAIITYKFPRKPDGTHTAKINLPAIHRGKRLDK